MEPNSVIQVTKDLDESYIQQSKSGQPIPDEPMEAVEDHVADIEIDNVDDNQVSQCDSCWPPVP